VGKSDFISRAVDTVRDPSEKKAAAWLNRSAMVSAHTERSIKEGIGDIWRERL